VRVDERVPLHIETRDYELSDRRMFDGRPVYVESGAKIHEFYGMVPIPIDASQRKGAWDYLRDLVDRRCAAMFPLDTEEREHVDRKVGELYYLRRRLMIEAAA
jgi:hypothetical protein